MLIGDNIMRRLASEYAGQVVYIDRETVQFEPSAEIMLYQKFDLTFDKTKAHIIIADNAPPNWSPIVVRLSDNAFNNKYSYRLLGDNIALYEYRGTFPAYHNSAEKINVKEKTLFSDYRILNKEFGIPPIIDMTGAGIGKTALLIGGGNSCNEFDFKKIDNDVVRILANADFPQLSGIRIDMQIYTDIGIADYLLTTDVPETRIVIGYRDALFNRCDYYFDYDCVEPGSHTGYFALQIAANIIGFDKIYLIGFDYYDVDGRIHCYGDDGRDVGSANFFKYDESQKAMYRDVSFYRFLSDFNRVQWPAKIYNLNEKSMLCNFPKVEKII